MSDFDGSFTVSIRRCLPHFILINFVVILDVGKCVEYHSYQVDKLTEIIAGLMDEISLKVNHLRIQDKVYSLNPFLQTYDALAYHVSQATMNRRRMKTVSLWSLQMTAGAVLSALRNSIDPMSVQLKEAYAHSSGQIQTKFHDVLPLVPEV